MPALPDQLPRPRSSPPIPGSDRRHALIPNPALQLSGGLGIAGILTGLTLLILSCAGFNAALDFSPAVITLGLVAAILAIFAAKKSHDSAILAAFFLSLLCLLGGVLELTVWLQWPILFSQR